jgi:hypothetical protein
MVDALLSYDSKYDYYAIMGLRYNAYTSEQNCIKSSICFAYDKWIETMGIDIHHPNFWKAMSLLDKIKATLCDDMLRGIYNHELGKTRYYIVRVSFDSDGVLLRSNTEIQLTSGMVDHNARLLNGDFDWYDELDTDSAFANMQPKIVDTMMYETGVITYKNTSKQYGYIRESTGSLLGECIIFFCPRILTLEEGTVVQYRRVFDAGYRWKAIDGSQINIHSYRMCILPDSTTASMTMQGSDLCSYLAEFGLDSFDVRQRGNYIIGKVCN